MSVTSITPVDDLAPLALAAAVLVAAAGPVAVDRDLLARGAVASVGSAAVAYGLREFLRAFGGGYYCCNHALYASTGLVVAAVGWVLLLVAIRGSLLDDA